MLPIPGRHVLHVGLVLQAPFYLERGHTGVEQTLQLVAALHVAHREQMTGDESVALGVFQRVGHAAKLCTLTPVGRTSVAHFGGEAAPAVGDTYGAVDEDLERHRGHRLVDAANLLQRQLAGQNGLQIAVPLAAPHIVYGAVVHLCGGVQRQVLDAPGQPLVLHDEGINAQAVELARQLFGLILFGVRQQRVERHIDLHPEGPGVAHHFRDILRRVAGGSARSVAGRTDIHGVGSVVYGRPRRLGVAGRRQQLNVSG